MSFYIDPVATLLGVEGAEITRVMVLSSLGDGPAPELPGSQDPTPDTPSAGRDQTDQQRAEPGDLTLSPGWTEISRETNEPTLGPGGPTLYQLGSGGRLMLADVFEFVPYNESRLARPVDRNFIAAAEARRQTLLTAPMDVLRRDALKALKRQYHATYKTSKSRNEISLYMFSGPIKSSGFLTHARSYGAKLQQKLPYCLFSNKASIIYTGDGYLDTREKWHRLAVYLETERTDSLLAFQVMHHGASSNWHAGLAKSVAARYAVFSSDTSHSRLRHPHESVKRDFEDVSHRCSADKCTGIVICAMRP